MSGSRATEEFIRADPNATYRVRRGVIREHAMQLTPIAAARATRRDEIVQLLEDAGARQE